MVVVVEMMVVGAQAEAGAALRGGGQNDGGRVHRVQAAAAAVLPCRCPCPCLLLHPSYLSTYLILSVVDGSVWVGTN